VYLLLPFPYALKTRLIAGTNLLLRSGRPSFHVDLNSPLFHVNRDLFFPFTPFLFFSPGKPVLSLKRSRAQATFFRRAYPDREAPFFFSPHNPRPLTITSVSDGFPQAADRVSLGKLLDLSFPIWKTSSRLFFSQIDDDIPFPLPVRPSPGRSGVPIVVGTLPCAIRCPLWFDPVGNCPFPAPQCTQAHRLRTPL